MIENRRRVLDMLAERKISVEEAERLLSLVDVSPPPEGGAQTPSAPREGPPRYLSVTVEEPDERVQHPCPPGARPRGHQANGAHSLSRRRRHQRGPEGKGHRHGRAEPGADGLDELVDAFAELEVEVQSDKGQVHVWVE